MQQMVFNQNNIIESETKMINFRKDIIEYIKREFDYLGNIFNYVIIVNHMKLKKNILVL